jgi:hypothetical protein
MTCNLTGMVLCSKGAARYLSTRKVSIVVA